MLCSVERTRNLSSTQTNIIITRTVSSVLLICGQLAGKRALSAWTPTWSTQLAVKISTKRESVRCSTHNDMDTSASYAFVLGDKTNRSCWRCWFRKWGGKLFVCLIFFAYSRLWMLTTLSRYRKGRPSQKSACQSDSYTSLRAVRQLYRCTVECKKCKRRPVRAFFRIPLSW